MGGAEAGPNQPEPEIGKPKAQHKKRKRKPTEDSPRKQEGRNRKRKAAEASPNKPNENEASLPKLEAKRRKRRESEATFKLERRYTAKRNEMATRSHTEAGKKLFSSTTPVHYLN